MTVLSRRGSGAPNLRSALGPRATGLHQAAPKQHRWRSVVLQALTLLALFSVQAVVLDGVRADVRADQGVGEKLAVSVVEQGVSPPVAITIPALEMTDSRLVGLRKNLDGSLQVPEDIQRAGWYSQGPAPGDDGPAVIVGHRDSFRGPGIFGRLDQLVSGDQISVRRADGSIVAFVVQGVETHAKRNFPTEAVYAGDGTPSLRLITCGGEFDAKARSYRDNVIVFAVPA